MRALAWALLLAGFTAGCSGATFTLEAAGPYADAAIVTPSIDRVAVLVRVSNESPDDLQVNPADFVTRDASRRVYVANPAATIADAKLVSASPSLRGAQPLPIITLRTGDVLSGFVVFDLPADVHPVQLIWRQTDSDRVVDLHATSSS